MITGDGAALAWDETFTVRPSTIVTVNGAPLPEVSVNVGKPFTMQGVKPTLVTMMVPVMVPAAPSPCPDDPLILHVAATAELEVVDDDGGAAVVDVVWSDA